MNQPIENLWIRCAVFFALACLIGWIALTYSCWDDIRPRARRPFGTKGCGLRSTCLIIVTAVAVTLLSGPWPFLAGLASSAAAPALLLSHRPAGTEEGQKPSGPIPDWVRSGLNLLHRQVTNRMDHDRDVWVSAGHERLFAEASKTLKSAKTTAMKLHNTLQQHTGGNEYREAALRAELEVIDAPKGDRSGSKAIADIRSAHWRLVGHAYDWGKDGLELFR